MYLCNRVKTNLVFTGEKKRSKKESLGRGVGKAGRLHVGSEATKNNNMVYHCLALKRVFPFFFLFSCSVPAKFFFLCLYSSEVIVMRVGFFSNVC